jgi:hypothetical protein
MRRWYSPYPYNDLRTLRTVVAVAVSVVGGLFPVCGVGVNSTDGIKAADLPGALPIVGFVVMFELVVWRTALVGVSVSDFGVRVRKVTRTHVIPWSRITRAWAGQAAHYDAWQIWISVSDPVRDIETPLWRKGSRAGHRNRIVLPPEVFAATLQALDPSRRAATHRCSA